MYLEADIKSCFSREQEFSRNGTKLMITLDMSILTKFLLTLNFTRIVGLRLVNCPTRQSLVLSIGSLH